MREKNQFLIYLYGGYEKEGEKSLKEFSFSVFDTKTNKVIKEATAAYSLDLEGKKSFQQGILDLDEYLYENMIANNDSFCFVVNGEDQLLSKTLKKQAQKEKVHLQAYYDKYYVLQDEFKRIMGTKGSVRLPITDMASTLIPSSVDGKSESQLVMEIVQILLIDSTSFIKPLFQSDASVSNIRENQAIHLTNISSGCTENYLRLLLTRNSIKVSHLAIQVNKKNENADLEAFAIIADDEGDSTTISPFPACSLHCEKGKEITVKPCSSKELVKFYQSKCQLKFGKSVKADTPKKSRPRTENSTSNPQGVQDKRRKIDNSNTSVGSLKSSKKYVVRMLGLPYSAKNREIIQFFNGLKVNEDDITIVIGLNGKLTGECFTVFRTLETFEMALARDRQRIFSRYIEVFPSSESELKNVKDRIQAYQTSRQMGMVNPNQRGLTNENPNEPNVLKLIGLPFSCSIGDIYTFFTPRYSSQIVADGVHFTCDRRDRPSGEAYVEFLCAEMAERALERHGQFIGSRYIELHQVLKREMLNKLMPSPAPAPLYRNNGCPPPSLYNNAPPYFTEVPATVLMRGLPYSASVQDVMHFFEGFQLDPASIQFRLNRETQRPTGEGWVRFINEDEAMRAISSKNGQNIGSRWIELFLE